MRAYKSIYDLPQDVCTLVAKGWFAVVEGTTVLAVFPGQSAAEDHLEYERREGRDAVMIPATHA
jgi:hypothetical protein